MANYNRIKYRISELKLKSRKIAGGEYAEQNT